MTTGVRPKLRLILGGKYEPRRPPATAAEMHAAGLCSMKVHAEPTMRTHQVAIDDAAPFECCRACARSYEELVLASGGMVIVRPLPLGPPTSPLRRA